MGPASEKAKQKEERPEKKREPTVSYPQQWTLQCILTHLN